jgi:hypothetical protein
MNTDTEPLTADLRPPTSALPPGITAEELQRHHDRQHRLSSAASVPLPGPLLAAFASDAPQIHGFTFQPFRVGTVALLERIASPFTPMMKLLARHGTPLEGETLEARSKRLATVIDEQLKITNDQMIEAIFLFVTPPARVRALLAAGRAAFSAEAQAKIGDVVTPQQFDELQAVAVAHFIRAYSTIVEYEPEQSGQPVFPSPPAEPKTASAGGSTSSAP